MVYVNKYLKRSKIHSFMLEIRDLSVKVGSKIIVRNISLDIKKGSKIVITGPNGSGKSSLCYGILGLKPYSISGRIFLDGEDITRKKTHIKVKKGLSLAFQHPPRVKGVKMIDLLKNINRDMDVYKIAEMLGIEHLLGRSVNTDFSGGERKLSELLQIILLKPRYVFFDELDSGMDVHRRKKIVKIIEKYVPKSGKVFITHSGSIIKDLRPDKVCVMLNGNLVSCSTNWLKVWNTIKKYGYEKCKECGLRTNK